MSFFPVRHIEQLLLDARANVEGGIQDSAENYTETPLQLASAAGTTKPRNYFTRAHKRIPTVKSDYELIELD